ncbi:unnamed protein product [Adineta ricciae]|uniref:Uncharacterized protein n=1 Tax=Adineta ricciae TaxID=249248 RepID=A0A815ZEU8_ADIRI|nr:unnamed protein product [Adineta ricciae]
MNDVDFVQELNFSYYQKRRRLIGCQSKCLIFKYLLILLMIACLVVISLFATKNYSRIVSALKVARTFVYFTCEPYTISENRSFFERDYPQANLPQEISNSSYQDSLRQLRSFRLVVLSCARNIENHIETYRNYIEPIIDLFHPSSSIHILESDSTDQTIVKLRQWSRVHVYFYGRLSRSISDRTERLAYCRNILLDKAHTLSADYIFMIDFDIFAMPVSSFLTNFKYHHNDWSVMTATTKGHYYDIWALRTLSDSVMNYDIWHRIWNLTKSPEHYCSESLVNQIIGVHTKQIPAERGLIEVRSGFGGAALYKLNSTRGCRYNGTGPTCEHVPFHSCIREKHQGRIFINPAFRII